MNYLTLGIEIIFPIFFVLFVGYVLKTSNLINEDFVEECTKLVFYIALPFSLFFSVRDAKIEYFDVKYAVFLITGTISLYILTWFFGRYFIKKQRQANGFCSLCLQIQLCVYWNSHAQLHKSQSQHGPCDYHHGIYSYSL